MRRILKLAAAMAYFCNLLGPTSVQGQQFEDPQAIAGNQSPAPELKPELDPSCNEDFVKNAAAKEDCSRGNKLACGFLASHLQAGSLAALAGGIGMMARQMKTDYTNARRLEKYSSAYEEVQNIRKARHYLLSQAEIVERNMQRSWNNDIDSIRSRVKSLREMIDPMTKDNGNSKLMGQAAKQILTAIKFDSNAGYLNDLNDLLKNKITMTAWEMEEAVMRNKFKPEIEELKQITAKKERLKKEAFKNFHAGDSKLNRALKEASLDLERAKVNYDDSANRLERTKGLGSWANLLIPGNLDDHDNDFHKLKTAERAKAQIFDRIDDNLKQQYEAIDKSFSEAGKTNSEIV